MATITKWNPFGVALNLTATAGTVTRTAYNKFTVSLNVSWAVYYSGNKTNYGMKASSGNNNKTLNIFGTASSSGSGTFTGTYTISGGEAQTKSITVVFTNYNSDNGDSATRSIMLQVSVPKWTSYTVSYSANSGTGAPASQTKWKGRSLTLSTVRPTRTGYTFLNWNTNSAGSGTTYRSGASYTNDSSVTLVAIWKPITYTITYDANGGTGAPARQTKRYNTALTLSSVEPVRADYKFLGWSISNSTTIASYLSGGTFEQNANVTLYAVWEEVDKNPIIENVVMYRCDEDGSENDYGTYFYLSFDWTCSYSLSEAKITIQYTNPETNGSSAYVIQALNQSNNTSGTFSQVIDYTVITDISYTIVISVKDASGLLSTKTIILPASLLTIDCLAGGNGIAFGKPSSKEGYLESNFIGLFSGGTAADVSTSHSGRVMVGDNVGTHLAMDENSIIAKSNGTSGANLSIQKQGGTTSFGGPIQPNAGFVNIGLATGTDLNNVTNPNIYYGEQIAEYGYLNTPVTAGTFTLRVEKAGDGRLRQEFSVCHKDKSESYIRYFYSDAWGDWYRVEDIQCKSIWSGAMHMNASHVVNLDEPISKQKNGIVLAFSAYSGARVDDDWFYYFVPKTHVRIHPGGKITVDSYTLSTWVTKYLYINDNTITGHADNVSTNNLKSCLRYVYGV